MVYLDRWTVTLSFSVAGRVLEPVPRSDRLFHGGRSRWYLYPDRVFVRKLLLLTRTAFYPLLCLSRGAFPLGYVNGRSGYPQVVVVSMSLLIVIVVTVAPTSFLLFRRVALLPTRRKLLFFVCSRCAPSNAFKPCTVYCFLLVPHGVPYFGPCWLKGPHLAFSGRCFTLPRSPSLPRRKKVTRASPLPLGWWWLVSLVVHQGGTEIHLQDLCSEDVLRERLRPKIPHPR